MNTSAVLISFYHVGKGDLNPVILRLPIGLNFVLWCSSTLCSASRAGLHMRSDKDN